MSRFLLFFIIFILSPLSLAEASTTLCDEVLGSGRIEGVYFYTRKEAREDLGVPFNISLEKREGQRFTGYSREPNTFLPESPSPDLEARIIGTCMGDRLFFRKTYSYEGGHTIIYSMKLRKKGLSLGTWRIPSSSSGFWKFR